MQLKSIVLTTYLEYLRRKYFSFQNILILAIVTIPENNTLANFRAPRVEAETKAMLIFSMTHIWRFLEIIDLQFSTITTKLNIPTADNDIS